MTIETKQPFDFINSRIQKTDSQAPAIAQTETVKQTEGLTEMSLAYDHS